MWGLVAELVSGEQITISSYNKISTLRKRGDKNESELWLPNRQSS